MTEPAGMSLRRRVARLAGGLLLRVAFVVLWLWCFGAIWYGGPGTPAIRGAAAVLFAGGFPFAWYAARKRRRPVVIVFFATVTAIVGLWTLKRPSNDRTWSSDMVVMPEVTVDGDVVHIRNVRDCRYDSTDDFTVRYYDATFDLNEIRSADFLVEPIWEWYEGSAHTMLTFGFEGDRYVSISVELRREAGEGFHPIAGMYKQFELMYVIGDERDLIRLRTNYRKDRCYLYPVAATDEVLRALFVDMVRRADALRERPEFYHTFLSSCTTNIVDHVNRIVPGQVPLSYEVYLPGYSGRLAYELGLIDTDVPFEETQRRCRIDELAREIGDDERFSARIRGAE